MFMCEHESYLKILEHEDVPKRVSDRVTKMYVRCAPHEGF